MGITTCCENCLLPSAEGEAEMGLDPATITLMAEVIPRLVPEERQTEVWVQAEQTSKPTLPVEKCFKLHSQTINEMFKDQGK